MSDPSAAFFVSGAIPLLVIGTTYELGIRRRSTIRRPVSTLRRAMFIAGIAAFLLSIEWPFAHWAHELFSVHQIGIVVARIIAPILIVASRPVGSLIAGLPRSVRRDFLRPGLSYPWVRRIWSLIATPPAALSLYVLTLYIWELPAAQADAIGAPAAGLAMHFSLFLAGLLFWSRVFERRVAPHAPIHGWRLMMILIAVLSQILLGAYLTNKSAIYYPAYAATQHLAGISAIADEQAGGFMIWVPSSFLSLLALIVAIDRWGRHETRMDEKRTRWSPSNSAILLYPETARAMRAMTRNKNRRLAIGMAGFVAMVFCAAFGSAIVGHRVTRRENLRQYRSLRP
ncbi:cytochrome c oxidase assembly protein [Sphingomonas sp.]|uniref:cytochrome c oxidase assembly protein n=1 Tax=Sphingomonas sp. TaxID=28214 RepID=UPI0025EF0DA3|nr:cytochrome c oxidase assembly protein [Sphingomonas sp.]